MSGYITCPARVILKADTAVALLVVDTGTVDLLLFGLEPCKAAGATSGFVLSDEKLSVDVVPETVL